MLSMVPNILESSKSCYYCSLCCSCCPNCQRPTEEKRKDGIIPFTFFGWKTGISFPEASINQTSRFKTRTYERNFDVPEMLLLTPAQSVVQNSDTDLQ